MAKESSSFFSCFPCFSENTQPPVDSCESAPVLADASANAIPNGYPEVQPSSYDNAAANSNVSPAAAAEEADGRGHDPKIVPSASAPPFQASASHDASSAAAAAGFSASAVPTQDAPSIGVSSSSFPTESDVIKIMHKAAAVDEENGNVNLEGLIQHISELLELIKRNKSDKKRSTDHHWPKCSGFLKLKEVLSEAASSLNDIIPTAPNLLKGIGQAHWVTAGLLVVSNILERFELAKYVQELKERLRLKEGMKDLIQEALEMIVKASIMCCVQINSPKFSRFFSASVDKEGLVKFQQELEKKYKHMNNRFDICLYYATDCRTVRPPIPLEREYPKYAVRIEEPLKEALNLLDWESEKNAVAVSGEVYSRRCCFCQTS